MNQRLSRRLAVTLGAIIALGLAAPVASALTTFCAEVKLEILQEATLEREAFDASLKVNNNLPDSPLTDLRVNVFVKDEQGNPADDVFFIKIATLTNTNAIDGTGVVQSSTTAEIRWLIIPSTGAGGMLPGGKRYSVKATINGTSASAAQSVTTFDDFITVYPQPSLKLEYVLPYEVFGDEPLTTGIEPIEPFPLGVRVTNVGYGTAKNFKIESAQPKIIDNKQALPVDFKLLGTVVGGTTIPDTLLVPFGDVAAGGVGQASWIMTTSLSGRFIEFTSTFTHAAELGGQLTSLIQSVTTYTLLRDVLVDLPGRDVTPDFLVNASLDRGAMQTMLDTGEQPNAELILESDQPTPLAVVEVPATLSGTLGGSNASLTMTFSQGVSSNIWVHSSVAFNKTPGLVLQSARASDGRTLGAKNVWISKHFRKDDLTVHYRLNILDLTSGASSYSINFDPTALDAAPGAVTDLAAVTGAAGGAVNLTWSAPGEDGYTGHILGGRYMIENKIDLSTPFAPAFAQVNFATSTDPGDAESYALGGLVGNATTYLSLWTQDTGGGISEISNSATAYTLPYPPRDLVLTAVSSVSAHAAWQAGNNALPIEYRVFSATAAGGVAVSSSPYQDSFEREFTFAGLAPGTTYTVFGVARNTETLVMSPVATLGQFMTSPSPDTTPPVTSLQVNGVTVSTAALVVTSTDTLGFIATDSESGVARTLYALDGGTEAVYVSTFSLAYGTYTLTYRSEDMAGNYEALQASSITSIAALYSAESGDGAASVSSPRADATITAVSTDTAASAYGVAVSSQGLIPATSSFYELLPSSVVFDPPALLSLRFSPVALDTATAAIYRFDGVAWDSAPVSGQQITDIGGGLLEISGTLQSASLYAVFALPPTLVSIEVTPSTASIAMGTTAQFEATGTFTDASTRTMTGEVAWSTDVSSMVAVSTTGTATGLLEGTALIIASSGAVTAQAVLTVTPATLVSIEIAPSTASIAMGTSIQFEATGTFTDASTRTLTGEVAWSTDVSSTVAVSTTGAATGLLEGTAAIIASSGAVTAQAVLTVTPAALVSIEVTPSTASIAMGTTMQFEATGTFTDASTRTLTGEVAWTTDVSSVATVDASGLAIGVGEGAALVIASSGAVTAQADLTVTPATLVSIEVTPSSATIAAGLTAQFEAIGTFTDASTRTLSGEVAWTTDLSTVASVDVSGLATGLIEGTAQVSASSGTISAFAELTVTAPTLVSINVAPSSATIAAGLTTQFETTGTFTDLSTRALTSEVVWTTDLSSVATVNASGLAAGVGEGTALVIASSGPITSQAILTVTPATLVSIAVTPPSASIAAGLTAQFEAAGTFTDGSTRTLTGEVAWSTDLSSVATVNASGLATGVGEGSALVIASSGTITAQAVLMVTPATLVSIAVTPPSVSIAAGLTTQFDAAGTFTDGSTRTLTGEVAWSTDASSVATVSASGLASGVGEGTALVIASSGTITAQAVLTVTPATLVSVAVTPPSASIATGLTAQFEAAGTFTDGSTRTLTGEVSWSTDASSVATISTNGLAAGVGEGSALVIASSGTITAQAVLTVTPPTLVSITLTPASASIAAGLTAQFEAAGTFTDGSTRTLTGESAWSTDASSVATVNTAGLATGLGEGASLVIASSGTITAQAVLTVTPATLVSIAVTPPSASISAGLTAQFEATGTFTDASTRTLTGEVAWSTDASSVATVNAAGLATGVGEGAALIIASSGTITAQAVLTVTPATLVSIAVAPPSASIAAGLTAQFEAMGSFSDSSTRTLTGEVAWSTDASSVATVNAAGLATGVGEGAALIIASSGTITAQAVLTVAPPTLVSIAMTPTSALVATGLTAQFEAAGTFTDASTRTLTGEVSWSTDASSVATVNTGLATGIGEGTALVIASSGTITAQAVLTVTPPTLVSITLTPASASIAAGLTAQFEAAGTFTDGSTRTLTGEIAWSTDASSVATVNAAGLATGDGEGAALVIASSGTITAQAVLTVTPATLVSITVTPPSASIATALTTQFEAGGTFTDGSTRTLTGEVAWSTDASTVATVSASGLATGVGEGVALVTASSGSVTAQAVLTVTPPTLVSLTVTPPTASIAAGTDAQFEATGTFTDASTRTLTGEVAWSTDPSTVATINAAGLAAGAGEGTALVFASSGAITGQASLTVSATYFTTASADGAATLSSSRADATITAVSPGSVASAYVAAAGQGLVSTMPSYYELQPSPVAFEPAALLSFTFDPAAVDTHTISIYRYNDPQWSTSPIAGQTIEILGPTLARASGYLSGASLYAVFYLPSVPPLTSIAVTPSSATILAGTAAQFEAAGTFADGSTRTLTGEVIWSTDVSSVATVNASGLATGVGGGAARVIASSGAITGFASLTVTLGPLTLASITPESAATGQTVQAALTGTGFDAATALTLERADALNGTWAAAGGFAQGRYLGTLTKLGDGRVLLAGGVGGPSAADIYNPATGAWTAAPALNQGRDQHAAVALADGRVLVSGGYASGAPVNSAEIYNPALNTWTTVASMNAVRAWHQMTLLADGRILAAGGTNGPGYLSSTEIYDPVANTWTPAASMSVGHSGAAMATLTGGKILVAGGFGGNLTGEVYDPATNAWTTATGALQASGYYLQAVRLSNGKVVIAGDPGGTTDLYDPATNALTAAAPLGTARYVHAMARVDGTALVIGGENSTALASTEFYDAAAGTWRPGPALTAPRTWLRGAVLEDGRVLVAGGLASVGGARLNTAELLGEPAASIAATGEAAADSQHLTGTLVLSGAATGYWDVIVRRTDGQIARLEDGFHISTAPAQTDFDAPIVTLSFSTPTFTASSGLVTIGTHSLVSLYAVDPSSSTPASGVAQILYAVDETTPSVVYTAPFTLAAGAHTVYFSATDVAGNASEISSAALSAAQSPFVGAFSPSSGAIGIAYSMAGFGFGAYGGANTHVRFGASTSPVSVWNDASIVGTVPGLSTGAHAVTLERWAGSTVTITAAGTYTVTPLVPTLSVATGPIGLPFTLTGPGFGTFSGANSRVLFAGATAPLSVWNDMTISGTIPGVADGTTTVVVERQTADGFVARSEPLPFTVTVPSVTSVVPSSAPIGAGFTLAGWSFGNFAGTNTQVLIGGATTPVSVWNDTTIVGTVPGALRPGEHELVVERRTADGFSARSASVPFTVEGLWLEAVSPSTGAIGIPFTLTGTGFGSYLGANSRVMFGVSTAAVSVWNNTTISGTVPTLATGAYAVTVERQQGTDVSVSNTSTFTVISPEIASVTPSSGPIGTVFTLSGTGFGPFAGVNTFLLLDGATTPISVWNDSTITATVPGGLTTGVKELTAVRRNADGGLSASNTTYFEVTGMSIDSINPSTGPIGIPFTIKGSQFGVFLGANSRVRFGVSTAAVSVWNDTTISGTLPALSTGAHAVVIERQQGTDVSFSAPSSFTVTDLAVGALTPSSGPIGVAFTITGEHFGPFAGTNTRLLLGGTPVAVSVWNDTTITGTVPDLAAGSQPLWLERKSGTGVQSSATAYFLVTTPEIASMVPSSAPIGAPFTLNGTSFGAYGGANTRVKFNGVVAAVSLWNDVKIVGTVPGAVSTGPAVLVVERAAGAGVSSSAEQAFEVLRPVISTVTPGYGPAGTVVTMTGHGFGPYGGTATRLLVGGSTVTVSLWNDTTIRWTVTAAFSNGDYPLVVRRSPAGGTVDSDPATFTVGTGYSGASFGFASTLSLAAQPDVNFEGGLNLPVDEGGRVETASKAAVEVPPNALEEDTEITLKRLHKDGLRTEASDAAKKRAAGEAIEFGPEGTLFNTPVTIELPYDPALTADESKLAVHYYDPLRRAWEELPSVVDRARHVVRAQTSHFSIYQPMGIAPTTVAQDEFYFRDQYAFPNPARGGAVTFRIQPGLADTIELRVYDLSGRKIHGSTDFTFRGAVDDGNGKGAQNTYDHVWGVSGVGSGVYRYVIKASRASQAPIVKSGKVGVIK